MNSFTFSDLQLIQHTDKQLVESYTQKHDFLSCEYSFANLMCWSTTYRNHIAEDHNKLILYCELDDDLLMPLGDNIQPDYLRTLSTTFQNQGKSGTISQVPQSYINDNPELSDFFCIEKTPEFADYIYTSESLLTLTGSKLNKKRNLIRQFEKQYSNAEIIIIDNSTREQCRKFMTQSNKTTNTDNPGLSEEELAINFAFDNYDQLNLFGVSILLENKVIAAALLSEASKKTIITHYEKADTSHKGIYQFLNRETARLLHDHYIYINREPDLGIEGLRRAKQSYLPHTHLVNYTLTPLSAI